MEFTPQFYAEPTLSWNKVDAPYGSGNANLVSTRLTYTVTPRMFVAALLQYTSLSASMSTNMRFRWEYQPGSELFVVYSDGRTTVGPGLSESREPVLRREGHETLSLVATGAAPQPQPSPALLTIARPRYLRGGIERGDGASRMHGRV